MQQQPNPAGLDISKGILILIGTLVAAEAALALAHITVNWYGEGYASGTHRLVHVDREGNLPSWFSAMQFFLLSMVLVMIYAAQRIVTPGKKLTFFWLVAAAGAFFLSADEGARIHERFGSMFYRAVRNAPDGSVLEMFSSYPSYFWALVYVPLALPAIVILVWFFWRELGRFRTLPILGMILFMIGAVFLDYLEGRYGTDDHRPWEVSFLGITKVIDTALIEEMFEMLGVTLVLFGCLLHASKLLMQISVKRV